MNDARSRRETLFARVRTVEAPMGAKERVREHLEAQTRRRRSAFWLAGVAATGAVAAVAWLLIVDPASPPSALPTEQPVVRHQPAEPDAPEVVSEPEVHESPPKPASTDLARGERARIAEGRAVVFGPAQFAQSEPDVLELTAGQAQVDGRMYVRSAQCNVEIDGRANVRTTSSGVMRVTVTAGYARAQDAAPACRIIDLTAPKQAVASRRKVKEAAPKEPTAEPSALSKQVQQFYSIRALETKSKERALRQWQAFRTQWPDSPLLHEADWRLLRLLTLTERHAQTRKEAKRFLRKHPDSPRIVEVKKWLEALPE